MKLRSLGLLAACVWLVAGAVAHAAAYDRDSPIGRLAHGLDEAPAHGWLIVSMKDDWNTVFVRQAHAK